MLNDPIQDSQRVDASLLSKPLATPDTIPTVSIFLTSNREEMDAFSISKGKSDFVFKFEKDKESKPSFFFDRNNPHFISFKHSVGFEEKTMAGHFVLQLVDPGREFEINFINTIVYNQNINEQFTEKVYIAYGVGEDFNNWSRPIISSINKVDIDVRSDGARIITLFLANTGSIGLDTAPGVDDLGRNVGTVGFVSFKSSDFGSLMPNLMKIPGVGRVHAATEHAEELGQGGDAVIRYLDDIIYICLKRYLDNIRGNVGNSVVLVPSLRNAVPRRDEKASFEERLNTGGMLNLLDIVNRPITPENNEDTLRLVGALNRVLGDFGMTSGSLILNDDFLNQISLPNNKHLITKYCKKLIDKSRVSVMIQAGTTEGKVDWHGPLDDFAKAMSRKFVTKHTYDDFPGITSGPTSFATPTMGKYVHRTINDINTLNLLFEEGIISNPDAECSIWGAEKLVNLFMKGYRKHPDKEPESATKYRKELISYMMQGGSTLNSNASVVYEALHDPEFINEMAEHTGGREPATTRRQSMLNILDNMTSLIEGNDTASHIDFMTGQVIPIFRSNVTNPNVLDLTIDLNPHYWNHLKGVGSTPIVKAKMEEIKTLTGLQKIQKKLAKDQRIQNILGAGPDPKVFQTHEGVSKIDIKMASMHNKDRRVILEQMVQTILHEMPVDAGLGAPVDMHAEVPPSPTPEYALMVQELVKSLWSIDSGVFAPISPSRIQGNLFDFDKIVYNQLSNMAYQADVVTLPMFNISHMSNIGDTIFLYASEPTVLGGFDNNSIDSMAIQSPEDTEKRKKYYSSFFTGFYHILAFEHNITKTKVDSHFKLFKSTSKYTSQEVNEYTSEYKKKRKKKLDEIIGTAIGTATKKSAQKAAARAVQYKNLKPVNPSIWSRIRGAVNEGKGLESLVTAGEAVAEKLKSVSEKVKYDKSVAAAQEDAKLQLMEEMADWLKRIAKDPKEIKHPWPEPLENVEEEMREQAMRGQMPHQQYREKQRATQNYREYLESKVKGTEDFENFEESLKGFTPEQKAKARKAHRELNVNNPKTGLSPNYQNTPYVNGNWKGTPPKR